MMPALTDEPLAAFILLGLIFPAPPAEITPQALKRAQKPAAAPPRANRAVAYGRTLASAASWSDRP